MENKKIIKVVKTDEEFFKSKEFKDSLKKTARNWFKNLKGVKFSDWNTELFRYTFPIYEISIPKLVVKGSLNGDKKMEKKFIKILTEKMKPLRYLVQTFGTTGYFVKLETRSPKDLPYLFDEHERMIGLKTAEEIVNALLDSMRTFDDLCHLVNIHKVIKIHLRPLRLIPKQSEWRVFVKNKQIIGISQQFYKDYFNYDLDYISKAEGKIVDFINNIVKYNVHAKSFVADVILHSSEIRLISGVYTNCEIIETNPYGLSDPCLFNTYEELENKDNKERFRYNKELK